MWTRWLGWAVWAVVAASAMAWALKFWVRPLPVPAHAVAVDQQRAARGDMLRVLGAAAPAPASDAASGPAPAAASDRIKLLGLVAAARPAAQGSQGLALLALDGKPPRTYRVGAAIDERWVVQSVSRRSVAIGPAGSAAAVVLEMPALASAATGTLPRAADGAAAPPPFPANPAPAGLPDVSAAPPPSAVTPAGGGVISAVPAAVGEGEAQANPPQTLSERRARRAARSAAD